MEKALKDEKCEPCRDGGPLLTEGQIRSLKGVLDEDWVVVDGHHLTRTYDFDDFKEALEFTNAVGEVAEEEGHHPEIRLGWGKVTLDIWTHKAGGLTKSDFVLATKIDHGA